MELQDINFETEVAGPKLLVLGAVHGNEVAGTKACEKLIKEINEGIIKLLIGKLILVPIANPLAYKKDVRQIEENLNRVIKKWTNPDTYEKKLAVEIAKKIDECDYMLDIHSTHNADDVPFSFLDNPSDGNLKIVNALEIKYVLSGWPEVYGKQNNIVDFSTETYANSINKNGITFESGYHKDEAAAELAYNSLINVLKTLEMIEGKPKNVDKKFIKMTDMVIKNKKGRFAKKFKHLDFLSKGEVIAIYNDGEKLTAEKDCHIIIPNHKAKIGAEWYYLGV